MPFIAEMVLAMNGIYNSFKHASTQKTITTKQSVYHGIVSLPRSGHALASLQMIKRKGTDKRLQCQCQTIVSVRANAMGHSEPI